MNRRRLLPGVPQDLDGVRVEFLDRVEWVQPGNLVIAMSIQLLIDEILWTQSGWVVVIIVISFLIVLDCALTGTRSGGQSVEVSLQINKLILLFGKREAPPRGGPTPRRAPKHVAS